MAVFGQNGEDRREDRVCLCQIRHRPGVVVQTRYRSAKRARCYATDMYKSCECDGAEWSRVGVYLENLAHADGTECFRTHCIRDLIAVKEGMRVDRMQCRDGKR